MVKNYITVQQNTVPIIPLEQATLQAWLQSQSDFCKSWVFACRFNAKQNEVCLIPDEKGTLKKILFGIKGYNDFWAFGNLPRVLPEGNYFIYNENNYFDDEQYQLILLAWGLGSYQFDKYTLRDTYNSQLYIPEKYNAERLKNMVANIYFVRDLINMPANDMGPSELAQESMKIAQEFNADIDVIKGEELLKQQYPAIYTVGAGAEKEPRLIDIKWGPASAPKVTLVGKGVCFDSGGLDVKSASNMLLMKKDMGGAAHVLGLARLIMQTNIPIRLRVLIPAVENSIDAKSYRPGDVIKTRSGITVEVSNTDAEGRLILCDALSEASHDNPEYLIDIATLTGAARVALGPEVSVMFSNHDVFANQMLSASDKIKDPLWRLPLYQPYCDHIKGDIADIANAGKIPQGGAITAALFLQRFVPDTIPWMHFDIMGYNNENQPGRPLGGEAMAFRSIFQFLCDKYLG